MRRVLFLILFIVGFTRSNAQDMPQMYKEADLYESKLEALCFYNKVSVSPIDKSSKFWYTVNTPQGVEYFIVDAIKRSKKSAFVQQRIADIIAVDSEKEIDPYQLKINNLNFVDDAKYASFNYGKFSYKVDLKNYSSTKKPIHDEREGQRYWGATGRDDMSARVKSPDGKSEAYVFGFRVCLRIFDSKY